MKIRSLLVFFAGFLGVVCAELVLTGSQSQNTQLPSAKKKTDPKTDIDRLLKRFVSEFVEVTPGEGKFPELFEMGSGDGDWTQPPHEVAVAHEFAIAKYEVPQNLYAAVMGRNPSVWQGPKRERNSVEMVSWSDAVAFCKAVTDLLHRAKLIKTDEEIRLPSEAEWEYCCRAGSTTRYSFGDNATRPTDQGKKASLLDPYGWHTGNAAGNDPPVGALKPNDWGLYDMHGYLWEYVSDAWHDNYRGAPDDGGSRDRNKQHALRVMRGGSWRDRHENLQSTTRWPIPDHAKSDAVGFRCVKARVNQ